MTSLSPSVRRGYALGSVATGTFGTVPGGGEVTAPEQMAPVNALLDVAPPALREALLIAFLDRLSR